MRICRQHVDIIDKKVRENPQYVASACMSMNQYMESQTPPCYDTLITSWLAYTEPLMYLSAAAMELVEVKSCLRMDGTFKIGTIKTTY